MKRRAFKISLMLLLAIGIFGLGCSRRTRFGSGTTASPTVAPALTSAASQPSPQPSAAAAGAAGASATAAPATKAGWWIRINPALTSAQMITFQIGTDKLNREEWRVWRTGEPTEFDVPANFAQAPRLYVRGNVTPIGRMADLCIMFKDRGVEHMGFNDDESELKTKFQIDPKCR